ncbi:Dual specificity protein phosphatase 23 [Plecturocebus cupreus]
MTATRRQGAAEPDPGLFLRSNQFLTRSWASFLAERAKPRGGNPAHYRDPANHHVAFPRSLGARAPRFSPAPGAGPIPKAGQSVPRDSAPQTTWPGRRRGQVGPMGVQPPNFSWVLPGRLAGLALPRLPAHYQFLLDLGVRHLVSLTERGPPHSDSCPGLTLHRLRIPDFCPPAPDQIDRFVQIVDEANARGEAVGVHCALGFGRTGTMLACYLVKERGLAAGDAIAEIRRLRPGSIETYEQEKAVFQFYQRTK